jgi:hypothetical protein
MGVVHPGSAWRALDCRLLRFGFVDLHGVKHAGDGTFARISYRTVQKDEKQATTSVAEGERKPWANTTEKK